MPLILRTIRKSKWYKNNNVAWLKQGEIQADALGDLLTKNNTLSVWLVEDDQSNIEQIVTALAASRDTISNLDYAIFQIDLLANANIKIENNEGATPYEKANRFHRDLVELTATKLINLAETILVNSQIERISEKKIGNLLETAVQNREIDKKKLRPGIANKL